MAVDKPIKYDFDGYEIITNAIIDLLNDFPLLETGEKFNFESSAKGLGMFPSDGAVVTSERVSITDHVTQQCAYPFFLVYKGAWTTEKQKINAKEFMDNVGRWLEKQEITDGLKTYKLEKYPSLSGNRKFTSISRQSPAFLGATGTDFAESWVIQITATYRNEFDR